MKNNKDLREVIPDLPRTNSIGMFNKTNKDHRKV